MNTVKEIRILRTSVGGYVILASYNGMFPLMGSVAKYMILADLV